MLLILTKIKKKCTFQQVYLIDVSLFIIHKSNFSISKHKKQKQKIGVSQLNVDQKVNKYINNYWLVIDRVRMYLKTGFQVLEEPGRINPIFGTGKCNFRQYNISDPSLNIGLFYGVVVGSWITKHCNEKMAISKLYQCASFDDVPWQLFLPFQIIYQYFHPFWQNIRWNGEHVFSQQPSEYSRR